MIDKPLNIPVVCGSVRPERRSLPAARLIHERVLAAGHMSPWVDLRELDLPIFGMAGEDPPPAVELNRIMGAADAAIWLTPEYNHSFSSAVKNAIDYLHRQIRRKPMLVCGLAGGVSGGTRAVEQLKLVLIEMHAVPIRESVYFTDARTIFDEDGVLLRPEFNHRIDECVAMLAWYAESLRWGRANLPVPGRSG
jgi:NAD(P)H-dependent FMN reductase